MSPRSASHSPATAAAASRNAVSESALQQTIIDAARSLGWLVAHFRPARTDRGWRTPVAADGQGFPDLVLAHPRGRVMFLEVKSRAGRVSLHQRRWLDTLAGAPVTCQVVRPADLDEIIALLRKEAVWP